MSVDQEEDPRVKLMYRNLLRDYECLKEKYGVIRERYEEVCEKERASFNELKEYREECLRFKALYQEILAERNQFKQQCSQAIKQWDQALKERNEFKDALAKTQRKHDEAIKEVNQSISVKLKAGKELQRLTDERNAAMQEYSLIMSERDLVHKEIEKLQDEVVTQKERVVSIENQAKLYEVDRRKMSCQIEILKREIQSSLNERDKSIRELHDLREKIGIPNEINELNPEGSYIYRRSCKKKLDRIDIYRTKRNVFSLCRQNLACKNNTHKCETLDEANSEVSRLMKLLEKFQKDLHDISIEADIDKGRRDLAFSERDKVIIEKETIRDLYDKLRRERDRVDCELAETLRDSVEMNKIRIKLQIDNKELRNRLDNLEKDKRHKSLQETSRRCCNYCQDCAILFGLSGWETKKIEIKMNNLHLNDDIGFDISGSKDKLICPNKLVNVSWVRKGGSADGKLLINDCIMKINKIDCQGLDKRKVLQILRSSGLILSLTIRRKLPSIEKILEKYGLLLDLGVYVVKTHPDFLAAEEHGISKGDRVASINGWCLEGIKNIEEVFKLLYFKSYHYLQISFVKFSSVFPCTLSIHSDSIMLNFNVLGVPMKDKLKEETSNVKILDKGMNIDLKQQEHRIRSPDINVHLLHKGLHQYKWFNNANLSTEKIYKHIYNNLEVKSEDGNEFYLDHRTDKRFFMANHHIKSEKMGKNEKEDKYIEPYSINTFEHCERTWPRVKNGAMIKIEDKKFHDRENDPFIMSKLMSDLPVYSVKKEEENNSKFNVNNEDDILFDEKKKTVPQMESNFNNIVLDTSVDDSVKSAQAEKDVLERYLRRSTFFKSFDVPENNNHMQSDSINTSSLIISQCSYINPLGSASKRISYDDLHDSRFSYPQSSNNSFICNTNGFKYSHQYFNSLSSTSKKYELSYPCDSQSHCASIANRMSNNKAEATLSMIEVPQFKSNNVDVNYQKLTNENENSKLSTKIRSVSGEIRQITIQKSSEQLGFMIEEGAHKGVFVSSVNENSLAQLVGLQVGDQLLDVCGINLRSCGKEQAALVLHQVGSTITLKVQYNPDDFLNDEEVVSMSEDDENVVRSDSLTPQNSPPSYATLMEHRFSSGSPGYEPRIVYLSLNKSRDLGLRLIGGNAVGIFIHSLDLNSAASNGGLRSGDQILEYEGVDLRCATAEEAAYELAKPGEKVCLVVEYNPVKYEGVKDRPGDSIYVRSMFHRIPEEASPHHLQFHKGDILYIDNTMFNGVPGNWSAWILDSEGEKRQWGLIPSKYKVEEEFLTRRSMGNLEVERKSWTSTRRSFFKRKRLGSKSEAIPKELASYSDMESLSYSDSGNIGEDSIVQSYLRVEKFSDFVIRPLLVIGPFADIVIEKLLIDYPHKFSKCETEITVCDQETLRKETMDNILIDFRNKGGCRFECTTLQSIKNADQNKHCILNIHVDSVDRLHLNKIYPIVLLIKFKSIKQIREIKDHRCSINKISQNDAKTIYEQTIKFENDYKHLLSGIVHAGANLMLICTQITSQIDEEQAKTLWVPSGQIW